MTGCGKSGGGASPMTAPCNAATSAASRTPLPVEVMSSARETMPSGPIQSRPRKRYGPGRVSSLRQSALRNPACSTADWLPKRGDDGFDGSATVCAGDRGRKRKSLVSHKARREAGPGKQVLQGTLAGQFASYERRATPCDRAGIDEHLQARSSTIGVKRHRQGLGWNIEMGPTLLRRLFGPCLRDGATC